MIDYNNLTDNAINNQVFFGTNDSNNWQTWQKPKNCNYVYITVIGSGGGGGGGRRSTSNTSSGGAGGGSGAITSGLFQSIVLPDTLYIQVGIGGSPGSGQTAQNNGGSGGSGAHSYVSVGPTSTNSYILLQSSTLVAAGGGGGTVSSGLAANGATLWSRYNIGFAGLGQVTTTAGQSSGAGNVNTSNGVSIAINKFVTGGAGGGGTSAGTSVSNGGNITGSGIIPTLLGTFGQNPAGNYTETKAPSGYQTRLPGKVYTARDPLLFTGGAGGGGLVQASGTGYAGAGGDGSFGSGGGGGGGLNLSTGVFGKSGDGGRGGDGLVIITCF